MTSGPASDNQLDPIGIVLLSDGIAGHFRQSEGIVAALKRRRPVTLTRVELPKRPGPVRFLLSLAVRLGLPLPLSWHLGNELLSSSPIDMIVSAGGRTLAANVALARHLGVPNLFSGSPRQFPVAAFSKVLLSYPATPDKGLYVLKPTALDPDSLSQPKQKRDASAGAPYRIAFLIGGPTEPCPWTDSDWRQMLDTAHSIALDPSLRLIAVTSRRTPAKWADTLLEKTAGLPGLEQIVDYRSAGPGSIAIAYGCDAMIVSGDSMSMVTEAVAARRPAVVLMPEQRRISRDDATMNDLERQNRIRILTAPHITIEKALEGFGTMEPMTANHLDHLADVVFSVLGKPAASR